MNAPRVEIRYCRQCNWLFRATWYAQELLTTFGDEIGEVALAPQTGGQFQILLDGNVLWDRQAMGGFPEIKLLKRLVRGWIAPGRSLGHTDRAAEGEAAPETPVDD